MSVRVNEAVTWTERNRGRCEVRIRRKNEGKRKKRGRKEKKLKRKTYIRHDKVQWIEGRRRT
jgi:hypothetical protein